MQSMRKLLDLLGIDVPVIQAPMAGASSAELVAAVANAGGLGSYGCSRLSPAQVIEQSPTSPSVSFIWRCAQRFSIAFSEPSFPRNTAIDRFQKDTSIAWPRFRFRSHSTGYQ